MAPATYVILSGCLTFGVPIAFGVWELLTMRPGGGGPWHDPILPEPPPPPDDAAFVRKPLPDCLIPKPLARTPELAD